MTDRSSSATAELSTTQPRNKRVRIKDTIEIHVEDTGGPGRPVILTHAWPLSSEIWQAQVKALSAAGYRVIAYDRRGFGQSSKPTGGYDFDTLADDLATLIESLNLRDAALFGYSMGGGEIVRYFSRHKGRNVTKVGFVGAAATCLLKSSDNPDGVDGAVFEGIKEGVRADRAGYLAVLLKDVLFDVSKRSSTPITQQMLDRWLQIGLQADLKATIECVDAFTGTDFRPELSSVKVPALVLHGTADIPVPIALARAIAQGIPGARMTEYEGVSHGLVVTEQDRVSRDMLTFLAS
jgi:non-heme chloroperoxidase